MGLEVIIFFLPHTHNLVSSVDAVKKQKTYLITVFLYFRIFSLFSSYRKRPFFVFPV
jgi:hypothetical protein